MSTHITATDIEAFLRRKYVQRADPRQKVMGLDYTEAETKDLARTIARFVNTFEPNAVCGDCQGSGYGGHPDSGAVCSTCHGSGGVYVDPVWQALGATTETEALERVTILQGVACVQGTSATS